jgi:hypothetical protein
VVTMKNVVFGDVTPSTSSQNRRFGGTYRLHQGGKNFLVPCFDCLVTANVVPSSPIVTLIMEVTFLRNVGLYKSHML